MQGKYPVHAFCVKEYNIYGDARLYWALLQLSECILLRNWPVSALRADYIINIYFILSTGVGYCERQPLKTIERKLKAKIDNIKAKRKKEKEQWNINQAMIPGHPGTTRWHQSTWFSCDDQIKTAILRRDLKENRFSWIVAARDWHARTHSHTLQLEDGHTLSFFPMCAMSFILRSKKEIKAIIQTGDVLSDIHWSSGQSSACASYTNIICDYLR